MTLIERLHAACSTVWRRFNLRIFWQLLIAFVLVTLLMAGTLFWAGRRAINETGEVVRDHVSPTNQLWADRLAGYYADAGSWDAVETMLADFPNGAAWAPWDESWAIPYTLAAPDGTILASDREEDIGRRLTGFAQQFATPIVVDGETMGQILLSLPPRADEPKAERGPWFIVGPDARGGRVVERLLGTSVYVTLIALLLGLFFSRSISRPLRELTQATQTVAEGDLSVRVSDAHAGEVGELAASFNQMAQSLQRADDLRRNMTADVAHELRTPLSVIRGKLEGVIDGVYPATAEHLVPVLEETAVLTHLVEDLRLLAQAEAGQLRLDRRATDIGDLLRDACVNFTPQAEDRRITLALDLPASLPQVQADWRRISQVLGNLITNALQHTPEGGTITLSAAVTAEEHVAVTVCDTGVGVLPEDMPYLFERFWRGDSARLRTKYGGTGLGLAIAKHLVELHDGTITVESEPGRGTTLRFTLG